MDDNKLSENSKRVRQHVNPLSSFFQRPLLLPGPEELFFDSNLPIHLDIGCARGMFLLQFAEIEKNWNFLGVDIRSSLVEKAELDRNNLHLENLKFLFCNANVSLESWLKGLKEGQLQRVSIQFPDPWFKKRHEKRRVLTPIFLHALAKALVPGSQLFIQSDVLPLINSMVQIVLLSKYFDAFGMNKLGSLEDNPYHISSEREDYAINNGLPVYRYLFIRNNNNNLSTI